MISTSYLWGKTLEWWEVKRWFLNLQKPTFDVSLVCALEEISNILSVVPIPAHLLLNEMYFFDSGVFKPRHSLFCLSRRTSKTCRMVFMDQDWEILYYITVCERINQEINQIFTRRILSNSLERVSYLLNIPVEALWHRNHRARLVFVLLSSENVHKCRICDKAVSSESPLLFISNCSVFVSVNAYGLLCCLVHCIVRDKQLTSLTLLLTRA